MKSALFALAGIVAGSGVTFALVVAVELFSAVVHPFPEGFEGTPEEMCQHVERYPGWVLATVVPAWAVAAAAGTWTAKKVGGLVVFVMVGLLTLSGLVLNISMLPYPLWFKLANLLAIPAAIIAADRLSARRKIATVNKPE